MIKRSFLPAIAQPPSEWQTAERWSHTCCGTNSSHGVDLGLDELAERLRDRAAQVMHAVVRTGTDGR